MPNEECEVFTKGKWDTGCIPNLQLEIYVKDNTLIRHIPGLLYEIGSRSYDVLTYCLCMNKDGEIHLQYVQGL